MVEKGIGLAISGGGFRATLFHLGAFWRLNELGYLKKMTRICSVSGGSITAALLGMKWNSLKFNQNDVATNFEDQVVHPLKKFCSQNIDVPAVLGGWLSAFKSPGDIITRRYDRLFKGATLAQLPTDDQGPRFIIYATNLQTGVSFRFSRPYLGDYRIGLLDHPQVSLAVAVAASSAFPPVLTPIMLKTNPNAWRKTKGANLYHQVDFRKEIYLSDGGVYDNLGLEAVWDRYETVLVSDAGSPFNTQKKPWLLKFSQLKKMLRVLDITINQTRALRKRQLISEFKNHVRGGSYWGIATHIDNYKLSNAVVKDNSTTASLQKIRTRLDKFSEKEQGQLINWGYALADAALRRHVIKESIPAGTWPIPKYALG